MNIRSAFTAAVLSLGLLVSASVADPNASGWPVMHIGVQVNGRVVLSAAGKVCTADSDYTISGDLPGCEGEWVWPIDDDDDSSPPDTTEEVTLRPEFASFSFEEPRRGDYILTVAPTEEGTCFVSLERLGVASGNCGTNDTLDVSPGHEYRWRVRWRIGEGKCWISLKRLAVKAPSG
jgi:hypothetical protein